MPTAIRARIARLAPQGDCRPGRRDARARGGDRACRDPRPVRGAASRTRARRMAGRARRSSSPRRLVAARRTEVGERRRSTRARYAHASRSIAALDDWIAEATRDGLVAIDAATRPRPTRCIAEIVGIALALGRTRPATCRSAIAPPTTCSPSGGLATGPDPGSAKRCRGSSRCSSIRACSRSGTTSSRTSWSSHGTASRWRRSTTSCSCPMCSMPAAAATDLDELATRHLGHAPIGVARTSPARAARRSPFDAGRDRPRLHLLRGNRRPDRCGCGACSSRASSPSA